MGRKVSMLLVYEANNMQSDRDQSFLRVPKFQKSVLTISNECMLHGAQGVADELSEA